MSTAWSIDTTHSEVGFWVRHMMVSKVRGQFKRWSATVTLPDEGSITGASVAAQIETGSVDTREEQRDNHLRSPDFLDTEKYPHMAFTSKSITAGGKDRYTVKGDLTLHGVTKEVDLDVSFLGKGKDPWGNERLGFHAETTLNRKDFELGWNQVLELGGVLVGEEVHVEIEAQLVRPSRAA